VPFAAIVLAAGRASRFGADKLLADLRGEPLVTHALRAALAAPVARVVLVGGGHLPMPDDPRLSRVDGGAGLSDSLRAGLAATGYADGTFVFLGDMPLVPHGLAAVLAGRLDGHLAVVPECGGQPGHPVLLSRAALPLALALAGDEGLGTVLRGRADVLRLPASEAGATIDVDTPAALAAISRRP
jgi:molybdenum cofactor cytidylyltransferase